MDHDWQALLWEQSTALADLIDGIDDADFDHDSLCEGWKVRDVIGHMLVGHTTPMLKILGLTAKYRFNVPRGSFEMSKDLAAKLTPEEIRTQWRAVAEQHTRNGIARTIPYPDGFIDHFIHEQDIRRPLGLPAPTDADRLIAALDATVKVKGPMFAPAKAVKGLRLEATDVDWSHGEGPVVRGPAEAIVLAAAGRKVALADLEGDGVAQISA
jgi:uncharacterized protein (TIGR03083 family)